MIARISQFKKLCVGVCAALALLLASSASAQLWRSAGLTGGDVRALGIDPRDPKVVYLGTTDGHVFSSRDAGESWKFLGVVGTNSNAVVTALIVDPRNSLRIYASTWTREANGEGGGAFISSDGGVTWRESGLRAHAVRALAQSVSDPDMLVAGSLDGVFVSQDGGRDWERLTPSGDEELRNFDSLAIDPVNPDIIYAGTFHLPWKTLDGGKHWSRIHSGMIDDSDVLSFAIDTTDSQRIFASACSGIYRSDSAGAAWKKLEGIPYSSRRTLVIRQDPGQPRLLYAGTTEGLWKSSDAGTNWRRISPRDWVINALVLNLPRDSLGPSSDLANDSRLLIGTERQGVIASDDGGATFHAANDGFYHRRILSVAVDAHDLRHVAAVLANAPESVVVSNDGGTSWAAMDGGLVGVGVRSIYSFPNGWWAALPSGGLARYDAARNIWLRTGTFWEIPVGSIVTKPADSRGTIVRPVVNELYVSEAGWFAATDQGLFASRNQGKTWFALRFVPAELPVQSVRVSEDGKAIRIVSSNGMVFSDDAGQSWTWHDLPLASGGALKLEWADQSTLLAEARNGVYISRDAGATWAKQQAGLPGARAEQILIRPGLWLVSLESAGLYESIDRGLSWLRVRTGDGNQKNGPREGRFPVLAADEGSQKVFAGSASEGLYVLEFGRRRTADAQGASGTAMPGGH